MTCSANYIDYLKTSNAHRALPTWKGVVKVPNQDVANFLEDVYDTNLPLVKQNLERKQNQSNIAKKRKAEEEAQQQQAQASSARADAPSSSAAAFLGPDPTADAAPRANDPQRTVRSAASSSGQPEARGHTTWSYNRDYYMACSVSGLGTVDNGGTEMGPAVVGFSGADRLFFECSLQRNQKWLCKLPYLICCVTGFSGLGLYKKTNTSEI